MALAVFSEDGGRLLSLCLQQTAGFLKSEPAGAVRAAVDRVTESCSVIRQVMVAGFKEMTEARISGEATWFTAHPKLVER